MPCGPVVSGGAEAVETWRARNIDFPPVLLPERRDRRRLAALRDADTALRQAAARGRRRDPGGSRLETRIRRLIRQAEGDSHGSESRPTGRRSPGAGRACLVSISLRTRSTPCGSTADAGRCGPSSIGIVAADVDSVILLMRLATGRGSGVAGRRRGDARRWPQAPGAGAPAGDGDRDVVIPPYSIGCRARLPELRGRRPLAPSARAGPGGRTTERIG